VQGVLSRRGCGGILTDKNSFREDLFSVIELILDEKEVVLQIYDKIDIVMSSA
jgi:hypothetical protein